MCCQDRRTCKTLEYRVRSGRRELSGNSYPKAELKTELRDPRRFRYRKETTD